MVHAERVNETHEMGTSCPGNLEGRRSGSSDSGRTEDGAGGHLSKRENSRAHVESEGCSQGRKKLSSLHGAVLRVRARKAGRGQPQRAWATAEGVGNRK